MADQTGSAHAHKDPASAWIVALIVVVGAAAVAAGFLWQQAALIGAGSAVALIGVVIARVLTLRARQERGDA